MTYADRFWSKVQKADGCWLWTGSTSARQSSRAYGRVFINGKTRPASQVAWELHNGESFPKGMDACHRCDNPRCVNPDHIFPGTASDNAFDAVKKGRYWNRARQTHCFHGHPFDETNTKYYLKNGKIARECRACHKERDAKRDYGKEAATRAALRGAKEGK